jgi:hypothetical protein
MTVEYSFQRYLSAKRSVDDRALNRAVWSQMADMIADIQKDRELKVLEVGAGIGTMFQRMLEWGTLSYASYHATDVLAENIEQAGVSIQGWAHQSGFGMSTVSRGSFRLKKTGQEIGLRLETVDVHDFLRQRENHKAYNLLIAHAFLDLFDLRLIIPQLFQMVTDSGLMLFTINFDGDTIFEPVWDANLEEEIMRAYHRSMDQRITEGQPSGDSRAGRHLFKILAENHLDILAAGSSDWVVFPRGRVYPADEGYFLHHILHFFEQTLSVDSGIDQDALQIWLAKRHAQIDGGELVYIAHQLDFLARRPF